MKINKEGSSLIISMLIVSLLSIIGISAATIATTDIKINKSYNDKKIAFYIAEAGIEHAKAALRHTLKGDNFTDQLVSASGDDKKLSGDGDDIRVISSLFGSGRYEVYLINDNKDGRFNTTDNNKSVIIRSTAETNEGTRSTLEATIERGIFFEPQAAINLIGAGSLYIEKNSKGNTITGDESEGCGGGSKPIIAVNDTVSFANITNEIKNSTNLYKTKEETVHITSEAEKNAIKAKYGININSVSDLKRFLKSISKGFDIKIESGKDTTGLDLGGGSKRKIVLSEGDLTLDKDGSGILIVKGDLLIKGGIQYNGLIVAIGSGKVEISGNTTLKGAIISANINTPLPGLDGSLNTADDEPGPSLLYINNMSDSAIEYCSNELKEASSLVPFRIAAFCDDTCTSTYLKKRYK